MSDLRHESVLMQVKPASIDACECKQRIERPQGKLCLTGGLDQKRPAGAWTDPRFLRLHEVAVFFRPADKHRGQNLAAAEALGPDTKRTLKPAAACNSTLSLSGARFQFS